MFRQVKKPQVWQPEDTNMAILLLKQVRVCSDAYTRCPSGDEKECLLSYMKFWAEYSALIIDQDVTPRAFGIGTQDRVHLKELWAALTTWNSGSCDAKRAAEMADPEGRGWRLAV
jgi:hypothetical protein